MQMERRMSASVLDKHKFKILGNGDIIAYAKRRTWTRCVTKILQHAHRRPCSDFMDMLRHLTSCHIFIIIIIISGNRPSYKDAKMV